MQAVNTENGKMRDILPVQAGTKNSQHVKNDSKAIKNGSFKEVVKKAFVDKNVQTSELQANAASVPKQTVQGANQTGLADMQLGELAALMAEADMTVLPFGFEIQQDQETQGRQIPQTQEQQELGQPPPQQLENTPYRAPVIATQAEAAVPQPNVAQAETKAPETQPVRNGPVVQEQVAEKPQQQEKNASGPNGETLIKEQPKAERQTPGKSSEGEVKFTLKQEDIKAEKPEAPIFTKPEIKPPDPEKVYVRVGNGENIDSEKFTSDIAGKILTSFSEGRQQIVIELEPQDLGKIIIKLILQNGRAEITMQCMNPETKQIVMMNAEAIRNIVEENLKMHTSLTLEEELEEYANQDDKDGQNKHEKKDDKQDDKLTEAEADIFIHQLRLGFAGELEAKT